MRLLSHRHLGLSAHELEFFAYRGHCEKLMHRYSYSGGASVVWGRRAKCNYSSIIKDFEPDCGFQSLVELLFYKSTLPSVVISPPSLRFQWRLDFSGDHAGRRSRPPAV